MGGVKETHFLLTGISHKTAGIEIREKVAFTPETITGALKGIHSIKGISECVVLSTCNRTEVYIVSSERSEKILELVERFIADFSGIDHTLSGCFYRYQGKDVIKHLFRVCSGLDSMILGEPQIFGQVKNAYSTACDYNCTGLALNRLFHHAFQVGKLIRNNTSIGKGAVSISFAAVELAKKVFGNLEGRSALLIGAGKIGEICSKQLKKSGIKRLYISNRTARRAAGLAEKLSGKTVPFGKILESGSMVDIIITSVTSDRPIFNASDFLPHIKNDGEKRLVLIDLGVPRNIKSDMPDNGQVIVYDIDDLDNIVFENRDRRKNEVNKAEALISKEVKAYRAWLKEREVIPVIRSLRKKFEKIRVEELEKEKNRIDPETYNTLDLITRRIVRKLIHNPTITVRQAASDDARERLIESVRELFIEDHDLND